MHDVELSGKPDIDFARLMIPHHQGAIDMAKVELLFGTDGVAMFDTLDRSRRWLLAIDSAAAGQEGLESGCPMRLLVKLVKTRFLDNAAKRKQNAPECSETFSTKSHCNYRCDSLLSETVPWIFGLPYRENMAKSPSNVAGYIRRPTP